MRLMRNFSFGSSQPDELLFTFHDVLSSMDAQDGTARMGDVERAAAERVVATRLLHAAQRQRLNTDRHVRRNLKR